MKYLIALCLFVSFLQIGVSQTMTWLPSKKVSNGCVDAGNAKKNIICYKLQYVPEKTGVLTSYTTGFWADCNNGKSTLISNQSCSMIDKSQYISGCEKFGKILLNCSGNSGTKVNNFVKKGVPVYLHQICFQIESKEEVKVMEDDMLDLTTSIDVEGEVASTFYPAYKTLSLKNDQLAEVEKTVDIVLSLKKKFTDALLTWSAVKETGTGFYTIERSADNVTFEPISKVEDRQEDSVNAQYSFVDDAKLTGQSYYRVSYFSLTELAAKSNVVNVNFESEVAVELYPNPAFDHINLKVDTKDEWISYKIFDASGTLKANAKVKSKELHKVNVGSLGSGVFNLIIDNKENLISRKFIVIAQ